MNYIKLTDEERDLVEKNHDLIYGYANQRNLDIDEWYGQLALELCKSVMNWNRDRGSLSTYFYLRADTMVMLDYQMRQYQKRRANENTSELNLEIMHDSMRDNTEELILKDLLQYGNEDVIQMRYEGYSQEEIAEVLDVDQSTISRILSNILEKYKEGSGKNH